MLSGIEAAKPKPLVLIAYHLKVGNHCGQSLFMFCEHLENLLRYLSPLQWTGIQLQRRKASLTSSVYCLCKHHLFGTRSRRSCDRKKPKNTSRCVQAWVLLGVRDDYVTRQNKRINRIKIHRTPWHNVLVSKCGGDTILFYLPSLPLPDRKAWSRTALWMFAPFERKDGNGIKGSSIQIWVSEG